MIYPFSLHNSLTPPPSKSTPPVRLLCKVWDFCFTDLTIECRTKSVEKTSLFYSVLQATVNGLCKIADGF